eukprot:GHVU01124661.1.p2 GENE.GHVU01124661.1~~GHVU01124661.1.p2  ORF type:complete len:127 (-),score=27.56 GHVU01124661.1:1249-1629(-)
MRNAINNLQSTVTGFSLVNKDNVMKVCDMPPPAQVLEVLRLCNAVDWARAHEEVMTLVELQGYTPLDIVAVMRSLLKTFDVKEHVLLEYIKEVGRAHFVMADGACTPLQLDKLLCNLCKISHLSAL